MTRPKIWDGYVWFWLAVTLVFTIVGYDPTGPLVITAVVATGNEIRQTIWDRTDPGVPRTRAVRRYPWPHP